MRQGDLGDRFSHVMVLAVRVVLSVRIVDGLGLFLLKSSGALFRLSCVFQACFPFEERCNSTSVGVNGKEEVLKGSIK